MKRHDFVRGSILLAAVAATAFVASTPTQPSVDPTGTPAGTAGLWVHLDSETGDLQAGPAASSALELDADTHNAVRRDSEGLKLVHHRNGAVSMDLLGRYQNVSMVRIDENGVATVCADNQTVIENVLKGQTQPATPEVK